MLKSLYIKNFALIQEAKVDFGQGLNIITGETGAGKSILLGALGLILGDKPDPDSIRTGTTKAVIEVEFHLGRPEIMPESLQELDLAEAQELLIRREIPLEGRSRAFINDSPINQNHLLELGERLVDLHGQHEHQSLLRLENHITFLDAFADVADLVTEVSTCFSGYLKLKKEWSELEQKEKLLREKKEFLAFQIKEITTVNPHPEEEEELLREEKILHNAEFLDQKARQLYQAFYEKEASVYEQVSNAVSILNELAEIDQYFTGLRSDTETIKITINEIANELQKYLANFQFDPQRLEEIRLRLGLFSGLKKKYGPNIAEVLNYCRRLEQDLQRLDSIEISKLELHKRIQVEKKRYSDLSETLSNRRKVAASRLEQQVSAELKTLGMPGVVFQVPVSQEPDSDGIAEIKNQSFRSSPQGIDQVEFLISANPGVPPRSLAKIASGGEISRVMLALKSVLAHNDRIPVLIFDEIDIGISGYIGQVVGKSLKKLSKYHQVICITHLPQIASMADHHYVVEKNSDGKTSWTSIRYLADTERAQQIATLLGGEQITAAHLKSALELIAEAKKLTSE